jgi:aspartate aminotransferase
MRISDRLSALKPSSTLAVTATASRLRAQGVNVLSFAAGEPDFDTPERVKRAAIGALQAGQTGYAPVPGDPETREVIAAKLRNENRIPDVTADHVVLTVGAKSAIYLAFSALFDAPQTAEDQGELVLPTPAWVSYAPQAALCGARIVEVPTSAATGFKMTPEQLRKAITPHTRAILINSPSNPCGVSYTPVELAALARTIGDATATIAPNAAVISDEIYEKIIYAGATHVSIGSFPEIARRTITINGMSKAYAMTGWRIGYLAGSGEFGRAMAQATARLQSQTTTSIPNFFQPAIRVALTECAEDVEMMRHAFAARAELIYERLAQLPGLVCPRPTGAFYVFPDVSAHFGRISAGGRPVGDALTFAEALLEEQYVAAVPGEDFLGAGSNCVRFSFACSEKQINEGMDRLGEFLGGLR